MTIPARSRVDRAGKRLRDYRRGVGPLGESELSTVLAVAEAFRAAHEVPMAAVAAQVRRLVRQVSGREPEVAERPKRMETIIDKLNRQPTMALSRMHDIAGCRAVLRDQPTADALIDAIRTYPAWSVRETTWDYVAAPKPDGYRAKHLVVIVEGSTLRSRCGRCFSTRGRSSSSASIVISAFAPSSVRPVRLSQPPCRMPQPPSLHTNEASWTSLRQSAS